MVNLRSILGLDDRAGREAEKLRKLGQERTGKSDAYLDDYLGQTRRDRAWWEKNFGGLMGDYDRLRGEAQFSDEDYNTAARESDLEVRKAFKRVMDEENRRNLRRGINPASGASIVGRNELQAQEAAASADAVNQTRRHLNDTQFSRMGSILQAGTGLVGQGAATQSALTNPYLQSANLAGAGAPEYFRQSAQMAAEPSDFQKYTLPAIGQAAGYAFGSGMFGGGGGGAAATGAGGMFSGMPNQGGGGLMSKPGGLQSYYSEGGMITGNPGGDDLQAYVISPDGTRSPITVKEGEYILPIPVVNEWGKENLDEAVKRINPMSARSQAFAQRDAMPMPGQQPQPQGQQVNPMMRGQDSSQSYYYGGLVAGQPDPNIPRPPPPKPLDPRLIPQDDGRIDGMGDALRYIGGEAREAIGNKAQQIGDTAGQFYRENDPALATKDWGYGTRFGAGSPQVTGQWPQPPAPEQTPHNQAWTGAGSLQNQATISPGPMWSIDEQGNPMWLGGQTHTQQTAQPQDRAWTGGGMHQNTGYTGIPEGADMQRGNVPWTGQGGGPQVIGYTGIPEGADMQLRQAAGTPALSGVPAVTEQTVSPESPQPGAGVASAASAASAASTGIPAEPASPQKAEPPMTMDEAKRQYQGIDSIRGETQEGGGWTPPRWLKAIGEDKKKNPWGALALIAGSAATRGGALEGYLKGKEEVRAEAETESEKQAQARKELLEGLGYQLKKDEFDLKKGESEREQKGKDADAAREAKLENDLYDALLSGNHVQSKYIAGIMGRNVDGVIDEMRKVPREAWTRALQLIQSGNPGEAENFLTGNYGEDGNSALQGIYSILNQRKNLFAEDKDSKGKGSALSVSLGVNENDALDAYKVNRAQKRNSQDPDYLGGSAEGQTAVTGVGSVIEPAVSEESAAVRQYLADGGSYAQIGRQGYVAPPVRGDDYFDVIKKEYKYGDTIKEQEPEPPNFLKRWFVEPFTKEDEASQRYAITPENFSERRKWVIRNAAEAAIVAAKGKFDPLFDNKVGRPSRIDDWYESNPAVAAATLNELYQNANSMVNELAKGDYRYDGPALNDKKTIRLAYLQRFMEDVKELIPKYFNLGIEGSVVGAQRLSENLDEYYRSTPESVRVYPETMRDVMWNMLESVITGDSQFGFGETRANLKMGQ